MSRPKKAGTRTRPREGRAADASRRRREVPPPAGLFLVSADVAVQYAIAHYCAGQSVTVQVCGSCGESAHAFAACLEAAPAAVLVDVEMDGGVGWRLLHDLHRQAPQIARVARVRAASTRLLVDASLAGVNVLCTQHDELPGVLRAVEHALAHQPYLSPGVQAILQSADLGALLTSIDPAHKPLCPREREVYALLGEGLSTEEIAKRLGRSRKTVHAHIEHIKQKRDIPTLDKLRQLAALDASRPGPPL